VRAHPTVEQAEQDVQAALAAQLEGEESWGPAKSSKLTTAPDTPSSIFTTPGRFSEPKNPPAQSCRSTCNHKPLCTEHDPQSEEVVHSGTNAPRLAPSLHAPGAFLKGPDKAGGVTTEEGGAPAPFKAPDDMESALTAEIADTGVPDPHMLVEVMCGPNCPPREKPNEGKPNTCKARPDAQGHRTMGSIDHIDTDAKVAHVAATPWHAHLGVIEQTLRYFSGTPHPPSFIHIETSSPVGGHSNADAADSTAEDWHTASGHAFPTDGGTTPKPSKQQDTTLLPITRSGHVAATHGRKEAPWPHTPDPDMSGSPKGPTTTFPTTTAAIAPVGDHHQHHHPHQVLGDDPGAAPDEAPASRERDCSSLPGRQGVDIIALRTPFLPLTRSPARFLFWTGLATDIDIQKHQTHWIVQGPPAQGESTCLVYCPTDDTAADVLTNRPPPAKKKHFTTSPGLCVK